MRSISASPTPFFDAVSRNTSSHGADPEAALDEFARVTKAGGEIILVNHLGAEAGPRRPLRAELCTGRAGWAGGRNYAAAAGAMGERTAACACSNAARCRRSDILADRFERLAGANGGGGRERMAGDADGTHMDVKPLARRLAQSLLSAVTSEHPAE